MTIIKGKSNITAEVICDSISSVNGKRITTFVLEYPRLIHSEFMTHRMISRNAASSRAIPFEKMLENLNGIPVRFGAANKGMQDKGVEYNEPIYVPGCSNISWEYVFPNSPEEAWEVAKYSATSFAESFYKAGYHKQVVNRLVEPFQTIKVITTATNWENFFWLRDDEAADPTIQELARCMKEAVSQSHPEELSPGQWHLPFITNTVTLYEQEFFIFNEEGKATWLPLEQAQKVSAARCAAISFRNEDYGLEKCLQVYDRLVGGERKHSSALEHQATPMGEPTQSDKYLWEEGMTHMDKDGNMWSGNFSGWIQHRQLIPNESKKG